MQLKRKFLLLDKPKMPETLAHLLKCVELSGKVRDCNRRIDLQIFKRETRKL